MGLNLCGWLTNGVLGNRLRILMHQHNSSLNMKDLESHLLLKIHYRRKNSIKNCENKMLIKKGLPYFFLHYRLEKVKSGKTSHNVLNSPQCYRTPPSLTSTSVPCLIITGEDSVSPINSKVFPELHVFTKTLIFYIII